MPPQNTILALVAFNCVLAGTNGLLDWSFHRVLDLADLLPIRDSKVSSVIQGDYASVTPGEGEPYIDLPAPHEARRKRSAGVPSVRPPAIAHDCVKAKTLASKRVTNFKTRSRTAGLIS